MITISSQSKLHTQSAIKRLKFVLITEILPQVSGKYYLRQSILVLLSSLDDTQDQLNIPPFRRPVPRLPQ